MTATRVSQPTETLHGGGVALSCALDGSVSAEALHGLFAADTRVLSTYRITLGGVGLQLLSRRREGMGTAEWHYQNRAFRGARGEVPEGTVSVELRRQVHGMLEDHIEVTSYLQGRLRTTLGVQLDADFADIFEVKRQRLPPRLAIGRTTRAWGVRLEYRRNDFQRGLDVVVSSPGPAPVVAGSRLTFELELDHARAWSACIEAIPLVDGQPIAGRHHPHLDAGLVEPVEIGCADLLAAPFRQGCRDLEALSVTANTGTFVAAGVPWFLTLFGRDTLMTSLMTGLVGSGLARGALAALAALQATGVDDWRDAEPGKLPHELREGELARRGVIPHTPYYGAHDAPALYCLALWNAWRWTGDRDLLTEHLGTASAALRWCDEYGDRDGDGLQEYGTRSRQGYYNQGWKDAGDAIVAADGSLAALPLATVELQGYLYAARLAMAELLEQVGDRSSAEGQRARARELAGLVESRFFLEGTGFYALALDGRKRPLATISSNPGHLLWCGLPSRTRAATLAARLVRPDLLSGWGLRTLSSEHPAYNPISYQLGSVWPHDTVLAAAGLARYGHHGPAGRLIQGVLEAAGTFEGDRLPELFCGFDRGSGPPVPYAEANVPQAWAAAAPILAAQVLLGLVPDAPRHRCFLTPRLPDWLPDLELKRIAIGAGALDVRVTRRGDATDVEAATTGDLEVVVGPVTAPLWGAP